MPPLQAVPTPITSAMAADLISSKLPPVISLFLTVALGAIGCRLAFSWTCATRGNTRRASVNRLCWLRNDIDTSLCVAQDKYSYVHAMPRDRIRRETTSVRLRRVIRTVLILEKAKQNAAPEKLDQIVLLASASFPLPGSTAACETELTARITNPLQHPVTLAQH